MDKALAPDCDCGARMVARSGPRGTFWGCSRYPECRLTRHATARKTLFDPAPAKGLAEADAQWRASLASAGVMTGDQYEQDFQTSPPLKRKRKPVKKSKPEPEPEPERPSVIPELAAVLSRIERIESAILGFKAVLTEILRTVSDQKSAPNPAPVGSSDGEIGELPPTGEPAPDDEIPF